MRHSGVLRAIVRTSVLVTAVAVGALVHGTPAAAHVTVHSASAVPGAHAMLTFRVPNEKDTASTIAVEVKVPQDTPSRPCLCDRCRAGPSR